MKVQSIKYVLWVQDMDRAVAFYRDTAGLTVRFHSADWSELAHGESVVALHSGANGIDTPTGLSIEVEDVYSACGDVVKAGGEVLEAPHARPGDSIRLARLTDTEGNEFTITAREP